MDFGYSKKVVEDMAKDIDRGMVMGEVNLLEKSGGKFCE
jgi:molybdenum cofactor biosynthesis enzyme